MEDLVKVKVQGSRSNITGTQSGQSVEKKVLKTAQRHEQGAARTDDKGMRRSHVQGKLMPNFVGVGGQNSRVSTLFFWMVVVYVTHNDNFSTILLAEGDVGWALYKVQIIASMYEVPPCRGRARQLPPFVRYR